MADGKTKFIFVPMRPVSCGKGWVSCQSSSSGHPWPFIILCVCVFPYFVEDISRNLGDNWIYASEDFYLGYMRCFLKCDLLKFAINGYTESCVDLNEFKFIPQTFGS